MQFIWNRQLKVIAKRRAPEPVVTEQPQEVALPEEPPQVPEEPPHVPEEPPQEVALPEEEETAPES